MFSSFTYSSVHIITILVLTTVSHALFHPSVAVNSTLSMQKAVLQQNLDMAPPFPVLEVATAHILSQIGANATTTENASMAETDLERPQNKAAVPQRKDAVAQCGPGLPCSDGSCCNSVSPLCSIEEIAMLIISQQEGQCGFTSNICKNSTTSTCISNCDASAMCGVDSLDGNQKCPLNLCCSAVGYCGVGQQFPIDLQALD